MRTALCNSQVWGFDWLEQRAPGHVEFWFHYYSQHLGVDQIYLYDLDGSFRDVGFIRELRAQGRVVYEPSIASIPPLKDLFESFGYKTSTTHMAQPLVQQHCLQRARQNADWAGPRDPGFRRVLAGFSTFLGSLVSFV